MLALPFEHLNLTRNPFGELEPDERAHLAHVDLDAILCHLKNTNAVVQVLGDCGRGKSTHLLAVKHQTPVGTYVYCEEDTRTPLPNLVGPLVIVDEAQRLSRHDRSRLFKSRFPVVIGTHVDYETLLLRAERDVLRIDVANLVTIDRLFHIFNDRVEFARRHQGTIPRVTRATTSRLMQKHGTNVRYMESDLYDVFQTMSEPIDV